MSSNLILIQACITVSKSFFKSTKHVNNHPSFELQYLLIRQLITNIWSAVLAFFVKPICDSCIITYCKDWCLTVNTSKTKILIFNKAGRLIKHSFRYGNENIECVSNCKYLFFNSKDAFRILLYNSLWA
jgi:hypothetical protein